ncbi:MAG TPA: SLC13 family permease, partial [Aestuariivirgaceae bacterium]|nr:SLC13 family permease [Aestuariivirgaceae bacterium]
MTVDQGIAFATLLGAFGLFVWGSLRHDVVAMLALLAVVLTGLVPFNQAFDGFAHPAVVTVAAVLILSRALQNAGIVDVIVRLLAPLRGRDTMQIGAQAGLIALLSGFMNNVGALALMLPVALRNAYRGGYPPALSLMPLAFASLLGGMVTLIGTPPNLIIAAFRARETGEPFAMFDFAPVGGAVALAGLVYIVFFGWRLLPAGRRGASDDVLDIGDYIAEVRVDADGKAEGKSLAEIEDLVEDEVRIVGLVRDDERRMVPPPTERVRAGDVLIVEAGPDSIKGLVDVADLELLDSEGLGTEELRAEGIEVVEAIIKPGSSLAGKTPASARLRRAYNINLLAVARHGKRIQKRLRNTKLQTGDVLLLQGPADTLADSLNEFGSLPLAERPLQIGRARRLLSAGGIFGLAIVATLFGLVPVHVAFAAAATAVVVFGIVRPGEIYDSIDWPVIVLLGAMIPVGVALETTGGAGLVADGIAAIGRDLAPMWTIALLLIATMFLSDAINNNATAVLMAPIGIGIARGLEASPDPFLMAIAVGASCAFLTPIGHQSNTLVMAPGGYRFGDYWRMGLPLEAIIVVVA